MRSLALIGPWLVALTACGEPSRSAAAAKLENVDPGRAAALLRDRPAITVLDVRTPREFAEGHLEGAVNLDFQAEDFAARLGELDRQKPYLLHCRSGRRSDKALATFERLGFTEVFHLDGGILAWEKAGLPVRK